MSDNADELAYAARPFYAAVGLCMAGRMRPDRGCNLCRRLFPRGAPALPSPKRVALR
jgi:hypothetical protein